MLPYSDQPAYLLRELKVQAQQGRDLLGAAAYLNADPDELDAWCRDNLPQGQDYDGWARHVISKYESDLLFAQQKLAAPSADGKHLGSPVAQRALLKHLQRKPARPKGAGLDGGLLLGSEEPASGAAVQVGDFLLLAGEVLTAKPTHHYDFARCVMQYSLVINPGAGERTPYANLSIVFASKAARDAAAQQLAAARLDNPADPLVLVGPAPAAPPAA